MNDRDLSRHAFERLQQRGVAPFVVDLLLEFGDLEYDHRGGEIRYFGKRARRRVERHLGRTVAKRIDDIWDSYVVSADGRVITAGHRYERIRRS